MARKSLACLALFAWIGGAVSGATFALVLNDHPSDKDCASAQPKNECCGMDLVPRQESAEEKLARLEAENADLRARAA